MNEKHAKISPSQISRIIRCPASIDFIDQLKVRELLPKEQTNIYADEGTLLHERMASYITKSFYKKKDLTDEQINTVEEAFDWYLSLRARENLGIPKVETKVSLKGYSIPECWGTADIIHDDNHYVALHVVDWKFGQGVPVPVDSNEQLMTYLLGAAGSWEELLKYQELWIHIAQPRLDYYGSYQCNLEEPKELIRRIRESIKLKFFKAGEKQCLWCGAKPYCATYRDYCESKASSVFESYAIAPLDTAELVVQNTTSFERIKQIYLLEPFFKKVFKMAKDHLESLTPGQLEELGMKRVSGRSNRQWKDPELVAEFFNSRGYDDIYEEPKMKSPSVLEKSLKGLKKDPEFQELVYKPLGAPTIVPINDMRLEYSQNPGEAFAALVKKNETK